MASNFDSNIPNDVSSVRAQLLSSKDAAFQKPKTFTFQNVLGALAPIGQAVLNKPGSSIGGGAKGLASVAISALTKNFGTPGAPPQIGGGFPGSPPSIGGGMGGLPGGGMGMGMDPYGMGGGDPMMSSIQAMQQSQMKMFAVQQLSQQHTLEATSRSNLSKAEHEALMNACRNIKA